MYIANFVKGGSVCKVRAALAFCAVNLRRVKPMSLKHLALTVLIVFACIYAANKVPFINNIVG